MRSKVMVLRFSVVETKCKSRTRSSQWQPLGTFNGKAKRQRDLFDFGQNPPSVVGKHSSCKGGAPGAPMGLVLEFGWCLKHRVPLMCTFGVLGLSCGGFTRQPENSKRAHFRFPALQTPPKFHKRTAKRGKKERKLWREREKKEQNSGRSGGGAKRTEPVLTNLCFFVCALLSMSLRWVPSCAS